MQLHGFKDSLGRIPLHQILKDAEASVSKRQNAALLLQQVVCVCACMCVCMRACVCVCVCMHVCVVASDPVNGCVCFTVY